MNKKKDLIIIAIYFDINKIEDFKDIVKVDNVIKIE